MSAKIISNIIGPQYMQRRSDIHSAERVHIKTMQSKNLTTERAAQNNNKKNHSNLFNFLQIHMKTCVL